VAWVSKKLIDQINRPPMIETMNWLATRTTFESLFPTTPVPIMETSYSTLMPDSASPSEQDVLVYAPTIVDLNNVPNIWEVNNISPFDLETPGIRYYEVRVAPSDSLQWNYYWCDSFDFDLHDSVNFISVEFFVDNNMVPENAITMFRESNSNGVCLNWVILLSDWKPGSAIILEIVFHLSEPIRKQLRTYNAGNYLYKMLVFVEPARIHESGIE